MKLTMKTCLLLALTTYWARNLQKKDYCEYKTCRSDKED